MVGTRAISLFRTDCRARFPITEVLYSCPTCGGLLEVEYSGEQPPSESLRTLWRSRRCNNDRIDQSGVWRYREIIPFLDETKHVVTLREGDTPLLPGTARRIMGRNGCARLQASGLQSYRVVQRQRNDVRRRAGGSTRNEESRMRLDRKHISLHGCLCQRCGPAANGISCRTATSHMANLRRHWNTARLRFRLKRISIRF